MYVVKSRDHQRLLIFILHPRVQANLSEQHKGTSGLQLRSLVMVAERAKTAIQVSLVSK